MAALLSSSILSACVKNAPGKNPAAATPSAFTFPEIAKTASEHHTIAAGYRADVLIGWGDALDGKTRYQQGKISPGQQAERFGYNNDYTAFLPIPAGSDNSERGILFVNHEYTNIILMFPNISPGEEKTSVTKKQMRVEQEALGCSILELYRYEKQWALVKSSLYARRITGTTPMRIGGPAAGHARMRTSEDPLGVRILGTFGNCAGGVTPWGTVLTCEENFDTFFAPLPGEEGPETANHKRYGVGEQGYYAWHRMDPRFDPAKEPNEPNRFGWVVEIDPYHPERSPVKRTALGRFKHESATCALTPGGKAVVYSGDDEEFEYLYRFISRYPVRTDVRELNDGLLDEGTLSVARFFEDGSMEWLDLVWGQGKLAEENGFFSQADVVIETRRAADLAGATPMDRPEDVEVHPESGHVFIAMTKNPLRKKRDPANPRAANPYGHIVELIPPDKDGQPDHGARLFRWEMFLMGGDPSDEKSGAYYPTPPSKDGWLTNPDNLAFDPKGRLWITTDGQGSAVGKDNGLYAAEVDGPRRGAPRLFFSGPRGAEVTGPSFTPDGKTLFLSVQHPAEWPDDSTYDAPSTRWPYFKDDEPPRPCVLAITREDGGEI